MRTSLAVRVIRRGQFTSSVHSPNAEVTRLIKRVVPAAGREYDPAARLWLVYASRMPALLAALEAAGITVEVTDTSGGGG